MRIITIHGGDIVWGIAAAVFAYQSDFSTAILCVIAASVFRIERMIQKGGA
jgi:DNA-binding IclR family transcriptional regulator